MEPVTTAILASIAAGAAAGATETVKLAISDCYKGLKKLLVSKFGGQSKVIEAVEKLEANPESAGWRESVGKELAETNANQDQALIAAADEVMAKLQEMPSSERQHIMQAIGSYIAQADRSSTAEVIVGRKE